jgi:HSP20 family protein
MPYIPNDEELDIQLAATRKEPQEQTEGSLTVDVYRDEGDIVIQSTIAGATPQDIEISFLDDMVTIKGSRQPDAKIRSNNYYYQELYWGPFSRSIILPEQVDADGAKANMKNGILTIRLPTLEKSKTKKLKIELK